jgi:hypothetical protein
MELVKVGGYDFSSHVMAPKIVSYFQEAFS